MQDIRLCPCLCNPMVKVQLMLTVGFQSFNLSNICVCCGVLIFLLKTSGDETLGR